MAYIAIDGPTGAGKSTTARLLAAALGTVAILDPVSASPLLVDYYAGDDSDEMALAIELDFLRLRTGLLESRPKGADAGEAMNVVGVSDFTIMRNGPFSEFLARPDHRSLVLDEMSAAVDRLERPLAMVLLRAEPETLLQRVRRRNRVAEAPLGLGHLRELCGHFDAWQQRLLAQSDHAMVLDTEDWSPHDEDNLDVLVAQLRPLIDTPRNGRSCVV